MACPCHVATVTSTHKGENYVYVGIPFWRPLVYVDDGIVPEGTGLKFDEAAFNWELAKAGYLVEIRAANWFTQTIPSTYLAGGTGSSWP